MMDPCGNPDELTQLLSGDLPAKREAFLREHLTRCDACQQSLEQLTQFPSLHWTRGMLGRHSVVEGPQLARKLAEVAHRLRQSEALPERSQVAAGAQHAARSDESVDLGNLGPYRVLQVLGKGGMGVVLLAEDASLDRLVALKLLRSDRNDKSSRTRFVREARAAAAIQHDHVVTIHHVANPPDGLPYLVMQYIPGPTLREQIDSCTRLELQRAARVAAEIASGLSAAHAAGLIHRDIKPGNIMLDPSDGRAKIMDFGLVRVATEAASVTQEGTSPGTPEYMSPEQILTPAAIDTRADVYSLGVTLYEMLTGTIPFRGAPQAVLQQVLGEEPRPPRKLNDRIPRDLETICLRAMEKEPPRRYQTAAQFRDDLVRWQRGEPIVAQPTGPLGRLWRWRRRHAALANLATASLLVVVIALTAIIWQWRRAEQHLAAARWQRTQTEKQQAEAEQASRRAQEAQGQLLSVMLQSQMRQDTRPDVLQRRVLEQFLALPRATIEQYGDDPAHALETAQAHMCEGQLCWRLGDYQETLAAYGRARRKLEALVEDSPQDAGLQHLLATSCHWMGVAHQELGATAPALDAHQQARAVQQRLVRTDPQALNYRLDLASSEIAIGKLLARSDQQPQASAALAEAGRLLLRLSRAAALSPDPAVRNDIAVAYRKLGDGLRLVSRLPAALEAYQLACDLGRALVAQEAGRSDFRSELGIALNQLGELLMETDRLEQAAEAFEQAATHQRQVVGQGQFQTLPRDWLKRALENLSQVHRRLGNLRRAVDAVLERKDLQPGDPDQLYWAAREIALCLAVPVTDAASPRREFTGLALDLLEQAIELGFDDVERLLNDAALAPLRGHARFESLVARCTQPR